MRQLSRRQFTIGATAAAPTAALPGRSARAQAYFRQQVNDWGEYVRIAGIAKQ